MTRCLLNLLTALSLLLCVTMVALWVRSYWRIDGLCGESDSLYHEMYTWRGGLWYGNLRLGNSWAGAMPRAVRRIDYGNPQLQLLFEDMRHGLIGWLGFGRSPTDVPIEDARLRLFVVPLWLPAIALVYLPVLHLLRWRRRTARSVHCASCGYNLTANVTGVCPECGRAIR